VEDSGGRREQILQAAQKLFAENGFRETNLNDVAIQLGFRRQAVYHYFRSKEDILYELIDRAGQSIATSARAPSAAPHPAGANRGSIPLSSTEFGLFSAHCPPNSGYARCSTGSQ
jgi:AcrR family transcriptional regulator